MKTRLVDTRKSVGHVVCHDITKIEKGSFKGAFFKKGHIIRNEDVDVLLGLGKYNIYVLELDAGDLHEDEAGIRIARALAGDGIVTKGPDEGKMDLKAQYRGLLKVDAARLHKINSIPHVVVSTLHNNSHVEEGAVVAATRVIPLAVKNRTVGRVESVCAASGPPVAVMPYQPVKMGIVVTGREIAGGRVRDAFGPVLAEKAAFYCMAQPDVTFAVDEKNEIAGAINNMLEQDCTLVIVTGGMSVDPDDVTPSAIKMTGARVVKYGAPILPGAMFMLAYKKNIPVIGLPACAMYFKTTVLDIFLPRIMAGVSISACDINSLGHGGLCRRCPACSFPNCSFGKGAC